MDVSPCALIFCYSVLCHSEGIAQLILLLISTQIFWKHPKHNTISCSEVAVHFLV